MITIIAVLLLCCSGNTPGHTFTLTCFHTSCHQGSSDEVHSLSDMVKLASVTSPQQ